MEKARKHLEKFTNSEESKAVSRLAITPHRPNVNSSFYECFSIQGMRVHSFRPGSVSFSFKVPPRLTDCDGNLAVGAIATLVDSLGAAVVYEDKGDETVPCVSVDMSVSFISSAKINDELEIFSRFLGNKGYYFGTNVVIRNKTTGKIVAEGRHSLFGISRSKI